MLNEYLTFKLLSTQKSSGNISNLDKLLLQIASPKFNNSMEIDHIFPTNGLKISNQVDRYLNLNHIANLCYLSKINNQIKSNRPPSKYKEYLLAQNEIKLHSEFMHQTFWDDLILENFNAEITNKAAFDSYLHIRGQKLIKNIVLRIGGTKNV